MKKVVLISGASKGLGAAMAVHFAKLGWAVAVNYRSDAEGAESVVKGITSAGGTAFAVHGDVTIEKDVKTLVEKVESNLGIIYAIVNNAVAPHDGRQFSNIRMEDIDRQYACSVRAPQLLLEATLDSMKSLGSGRIVNIGSEIQLKGSPDFVHYIVGKMGMQGLTRAWAKGLAPFGITVNMVCPGWTPVERHAGSEEGQKAQAKLNPMGRLGSVSDIAEAVAYFCSPGASYVSGQLLAVNGADTLA